MSFFFIRPYSSRGIGIWSYVTKLHIERAKRVVKKAECFFQIENLRSLFNLWLTDIFLKGFMMQQTAIRLSSHYIAACRQLFFCFWMVNLNAYTNTCLVQKIVWNTQWGCIFFLHLHVHQNCELLSDMFNKTGRSTQMCSNVHFIISFIF